MKNKGFTLIELMIVVAILAILSVVAVPAFINYMRKAKTTEAIDALDKMVKGAAEYIQVPRADKDNEGAKIPCMFPVDSVYTPLDQDCCNGNDDDDDDRCDGDENELAEWTDSLTWSALKFQMAGQHYFYYFFDSNGSTGTLSRFEAFAHADLDCDTVTSTFIRYGKAIVVQGEDGLANEKECAYSQAGQPYIENETE